MQPAIGALGESHLLHMAVWSGCVCQMWCATLAAQPLSLRLLSIVGMA